MKNIYTIIFAQNNSDKDQNYLIELNEINKNEDNLKQVLIKLEFVPRQMVVEKLLNFARNSK